MALEDFVNRIFGDFPDNLVRHLPALENEQRGDAANVEFARDIHIVVHVQLHDRQLPRILARYFLDGRRQHLARTAPVGPEIHQYRLSLARFDHVGLEGRFVYILQNAIFTHISPFVRAPSSKGPLSAIS